MHAQMPRVYSIGGGGMTNTPDIDEQVNAAIHGMTEKMSVHTGVKWQLQRTPYESEIDIVSDGRVIATVEAGDGKEKVAQMMVAAPDMLEALEAVNSELLDLDGDIIQWVDVIMRVRAAIRKARGRE